LTIPATAQFPPFEAIELLGLASVPASARIDGKSVRDLHFDATTHRVRIAVPDQKTRQIDYQP